MTKVIVHGVSGMMGKTVVRLCEESESVVVVAGVDPRETKMRYDFPIFKSLGECDIEADVVIDFSTAKAINKLVNDAMFRKIGVVICTTGISQDDADLIEEASKVIPIFKSANMSLGINLMLDLLRRASKVLYDADFDIEIIEKHHNKKIDSPSGTALLLANTIESELRENMEYKYDRSSDFHARDRKEIGIHGVRGGSIVGEHQVMYAGQDEIIEITHKANSKDVFATGAINAAKYLRRKNAGMYDMHDLLKMM